MDGFFFFVVMWLTAPAFLVRFYGPSQTLAYPAYVDEFLETVRGKCFEKCITKPESSQRGSESSYISRCVDRYIEIVGIVSIPLFRPNLKFFAAYSS